MSDFHSILGDITQTLTLPGTVVGGNLAEVGSGAGSAIGRVGSGAGSATGSILGGAFGSLSSNPMVLIAGAIVLIIILKK